MEKITLIPAYAEEHLRMVVGAANSRLAALKEFVEAHGEGWAEVRQYAAKGPQWRVEERKDECRAWLDKTHAPAYLRDDAISRAVADLGQDSLDYWRELGQYLTIRPENITSSVPLDLAKDVDATDAAWTVSQRWIDARREAMRVTLPSWIADEAGTFRQLRDSAARLMDLGCGFAAKSIVDSLLQGFSCEITPEMLYGISLRVPKN